MNENIFERRRQNDNSDRDDDAHQVRFGDRRENGLIRQIIDQVEKNVQENHKLNLMEKSSTERPHDPSASKEDPYEYFPAFLEEYLEKMWSEWL
ncbi:Uncharacterised protein at_DN0846, partial [Pycnogonum litorale]